MTNHHDPIEAWLSRDVELLPPPAGAYQRVRRRARRRKAVRTIGAAAGVAVIIAAAGGLPQLAGNLFPGVNPARVASKSAVPSSPPPSPAGTPKPRPSTGAPLSKGPALSTAGNGPQVPPGFRPTSVTFVNGSLGAVIGQANSSCGAGPCTVMAGTPDYGIHWSKVGAPPTGRPDGSHGVSQIRFLINEQDGWAYGPDLWATRDGGRHWAQERLPGRVVDLSTVSGRVFAVAATGCTGTGIGYAAGCTRFSLYTALARGGKWGPVINSVAARVAPGGLQLTAKHGYLMADGVLYSGPLDGGAWTPVSTASPTTPSCLTNRAGPGPWLLAANPGALYLACGSAAAGQPPALYVSGDGGQNWQAKGAIPGSGAATSLAVSPDGHLVLATRTGILYSADARTWHRAVLDGHAPRGFRFVGMTTSSNGVAVPADTGLHEVFITLDGGATWRHHIIR